MKSKWLHVVKWYMWASILSGRHLVFLSFIPLRKHCYTFSKEAEALGAYNALNDSVTTRYSEWMYLGSFFLCRSVHTMCPGHPTHALSSSTWSPSLLPLGEQCMAFKSASARAARDDCCLFKPSNFLISTKAIVSFAMRRKHLRKADGYFASLPETRGCLWRSVSSKFTCRKLQAVCRHAPFAWVSLFRLNLGFSVGSCSVHLLTVNAVSYCSSSLTCPVPDDHLETMEKSNSGRHSFAF